MKYLFLILLLLPFTNCLVAQESSKKIEWGPEFNHNPFTNSEVIGRIGSDFFIYKRALNRIEGLENSGKTIFLERFTEKLEKVAEGEISLKYENQKRQFIQFLILDSRLYSFSYHANKKAKKTKIYVEEIDPTSLNTLMSPRVLATISLEKSKWESNATLSISPDSSQVLITYTHPDYKDKNARYTFATFDHELTPLWSKTIDLDFEKRFFEKAQFIISNQGAVILAAVLNEYVLNTT